MTEECNNFVMEEAMNNLGDAFDYVVHDYNMDLDEFMDMFIVSGIAREYEYKNATYVLGMSGPELVWSVFDKVGLDNDYRKFTDIIGRKTKEYWSGWILAYYQCITGRSYNNIMSYISVNGIKEMYNPLHEAHEDSFVEVLNNYIEKQPLKSKIKEYRLDNGITQIELSKRSGVSLRAIQMYEQLRKDIRKANVTSAVKLARELGCRVEDLIE